RQRQEKRNNKRWNQIINVAEYYHGMFNIKPENKSFDPYDTGMLLVHAYPERIASARPGNDARFQLSNGSYAIASHKDDLAHEPWLSVAHMDARQGMGKIFLAAPLNPADLKPLIKTSETIIWDTRKGGLAATRNLKIGSLVLQSKPLYSPDPDKVTNVICDAINKEGENLLNFSDETKQWQSRIRSLKIWNPEENWPDVTTATLLKTCKDWLHPYLSNIKRNEDLKKIDLLNALHFHLPPDKQTALERLAPTRIKVPSGSFIKIIYQYDASAPVLAVRLQEIFGMAETPTINDGKIPVLLHLLSPGFKPVQVTSDLRSFWNNTYFEVKKELKNRYPKHLWPDNPWEEKAIRGTKRNQK
ncbi:MAG: ATP-dependent helicase C-terminal domain-containing protein, partial [Bacteroidota bacterium]